MDSLVSTAARALAAGDPLAALKCIALRDDAPALALRGIALAQLGEFVQARKLLARAERSFDVKEVVARARCAVAAAEVALSARELGDGERELSREAEVLDRHGDRANAAFARLIDVRRAALLGRLDAAERGLARIEARALPARLAAVLHLVAAEIATRRLAVEDALAALVRADAAAEESGIAPLLAEVAHARATLGAPSARATDESGERLLDLAGVQQLLGSGVLVVDACRREVRWKEQVVPLISRPVLFALAQGLAECAPAGATRDQLIGRAFGAKRPNESHRARLRVELGRLRKLLRGLAHVDATPDGFLLSPIGTTGVTLLSPLVAGDASAVVALLGRGEAWSSSGLALALGRSQRSLQRALGELERSGRIHALGRGRARKWVAPPSPGFATTLLLVARGAFT